MTGGGPEDELVRGQCGARLLLLLPSVGGCHAIIRRRQRRRSAEQHRHAQRENGRRGQEPQMCGTTRRDHKPSDLSRPGGRPQLFRECIDAHSAR